MLNYVWMGLIFLGMAAAISLDVSDKLSDRYAGNKLVPAVVNFKDSTFNPNGKNSVSIHITADNYRKVFNEQISGDLIYESQLKFEDGKATFYFTDNLPPLWKKMAKVNGKENDLTGIIILGKKIDGVNYSASLKMEEVSFVKLKEVTTSALSYAETAVTISLGLIGVMALWLGIMKIAEEAGIINYIARAVKPITRFLYPDVPSDHPAMGAMIMNFSANFLGLGNAATPFGLKAMEELDKLNPEKGTATNAMCTFLAINTAGMTMIPATAIAIRASAGSSEPAIIIGTSLFGSFCATTVAIISAKIFENFPLKGKSFFSIFSGQLKYILLFLLVPFILIALTVSGVFGSLFSFITPQLIKNIVQVVSTLAIPVLIILFVGLGAIKKVKVYETFVEGAKEGFNIAVRIIPYLVAMLAAIGIFRAGGAMEWLVYGLQFVTNPLGMPAEALPMALMRPLSGSGSLGVMAEIISVHGPDSFIGILVSTFYGSSETTFYVLAVYFGSVNIKKTRHALPSGLLADIAGMLGALFIVKLLFG